MSQGRLIYKCRMCGAETDNTHTPDVRHTVICLMLDAPLPKEWSGVPVGKTDIHHCGDKRLGVADLIGGRED